LALEGVAALRVAYFEEMAADWEADPTEEESETGDDEARATRMDPAPEFEPTGGWAAMIDNEFEEEELDPPLRQVFATTRNKTRQSWVGCRDTQMLTSSRHRRDGRPDAGGDSTGGEPEPEDLRGQLNAHANDRGRCVEAAAALAHSTTVSYAERGTGPVPEPQAVVDALRTWLRPRTIDHSTRTLIDGLLAAEHLEMWDILARGYDWGVPLLWLAQRALCLPGE
jgi:hypothetical protein